MGGFGTGKTTDILNVALWSQRTQSPAQFWYIDTDDSLEAMLVGEYAELTNLHPYPVWNWEEYTKATADIANRVTPDDWAVLDFVTPAWDWVQRYYIAEYFKEAKGDFMLEFRKANAGGGNALDGWKDWGVINALYRDWMMAVLEMRCHKYWTARPEQIQDSDKAELRAIFGPFGVKPGGQKELGFQTHTVLLKRILKAGDVYMTTVKDRGRAPLEGAKCNQFTIDYLVSVAGWRMD